MAIAAAPRRTGAGRQPLVVEQLRDRRDELEAHNAEALAFCDSVWPIVSRLEVAAQHLGPVTHQLTLQLIARLAAYERRHLPEDPATSEAAA